MKRLMLGNEAVARGLYEAGCRFVSSYPGTPSTEITEFAAKYPEVYAEWAPNEKVAVESAIGASIAGARAFAAMKHVGANVAADPIFTVAYSGVSGGLVIAVADDPGMHSSQNEQDSRHYAEAAKIPMLEPSDSTECRDYAKLAFELSEEYDTPIFLRLVTRIAHSQSIVELQDRADIPMKEYVKNPQKYVMAPANAKRRHPFVEDRLARMARWAEDCALNRIEWGDRKIGIIASGACYQYAREVMGDRASYLKLGLVFPLPTELIKTFAAGVDKLYVIEELDDVLETHCRKLGIEVTGKSLFPLVDEFSQELVREKLLGELPDAIEFDAPVPVRPPVLCPGCPHRGFFYTAAKLKLTVLGDIGCYTLGSGRAAVGDGYHHLHGRLDLLAPRFQQDEAGDEEPDDCGHRRFDLRTLGYHRAGQHRLQPECLDGGHPRQLDHRHDRPSAEPDHRPDAAGRSHLRDQSGGALPRGRHQAGAGGGPLQPQGDGDHPQGGAGGRRAVGHHRPPSLRAVKDGEASSAPRGQPGRLQGLQGLL